jgi:sulfite exporter TauE/SafE
MIEFWPTLTAGLLAGLLGSAHCLGMCAGISGLFAVRSEASSLRNKIPHALAYNAGRVISYVLLGAMVAVFGNAIVAAIPGIAGPVRLFSGIIIVLIGLQIAFNWRILQPIEQLGVHVWQRVSPAAQNLLPVTTVPRALGLGLLWGLLPCGLVYSMLILAAATADPVAGALTMAAFGMGTTPAMLVTGLGAVQLSRILAKRSARLGAGLLIVLVGLLTLAMPVSKLVDGPQDTHQHHAM